MNDQRIFSDIDVLSFGTLDTRFKGLLVANAKVGKLETGLLVDDAAELNFIDRDFSDENAISTKHAPEFAVSRN